MYYDDPYDPNLPNDYDDEFITSTYNHVDSNSISDDGSMDTTRRNRKKKYDELKNIDKGYVKTHIFSGYSKIPLEYYKTVNIPGAKIRNAVTGIYESYYVGKKDEDLYFKVMNTTAKDTNSESHLLFYDSPEQYEKHFQSELSDALKQNWLQKSSTARSRLIEESNAKYEREEVVIH